MSTQTQAKTPEQLTPKAAALEAAREALSAAVEEMQERARKVARAESAQREAQGLPKLKRLKMELSVRDALRLLVAQAHLGMGKLATGNALRAFSEYWTGGGGTGEALQLPSGIVLARWLAGGDVMPLETAAQYVRRSEAVEVARRQVIERLRAMQASGLVLDVAIRTMLDVAVQGETAEAREVADLLRRARDPRGGSRGGPWAGLPSEKSLWRWIGVSNLANGDLKPKRGGRKHPPPMWADAAAAICSEDPGASVNVVHVELSKRLAAAGAIELPSAWAVRRWMAKRNQKAAAH